MKKNILNQSFFISLLIMTMITLTACDPSHYKFDYEDLQNSVVSIELVEYHNQEQKHFFSWVPNHFSKLVNYQFDNQTVLELLNDDRVSTFLKQLSESNILYRYYAFDSPNNICIKLNYKNGDFEIITCDYNSQSFAGYIGRYNSDGEVIDFVGTFSNVESFTFLVNDFFETKI